MHGESGDAMIDCLGIAPENRWKLLELLAGAFKQGIDTGLAIADFNDGDPTEPVIYYAKGFDDGDRRGHTRGYQEAIEDME